MKKSLALLFALVLATPVGAQSLGPSGGGSGTVSSVGITPSPSLSVAGSPVTGSGNITLTYRPPSRQVFRGATSGTYTTPANVSLIKVTLCGATGGGGGSGTGTSGGAGGTPAASTFAGGTLSCAGGAGASAGSGSGGTFGVCTGTGDIYPGNNGIDSATSIAGVFLQGSTGGVTPFVSTTGGKGGTANGAINNGAGGGSGSCIVNFISSPAATYAYSLAAGGTAGAAGTSGVIGLVGAPAVLIVEEF